MDAKKLLGVVLAAGLGLSTFSTAADVLAQPKGKKQAAAAVAADPPMTKKPIVVEPAGIGWGMTPKQLAELYDKVLDEDYRPLYKQVSPGVKMKALDAQLAEDKNAFRRSRIDFGKLPTGIDSTPLKGEYTYLNKESMLQIGRGGETRYFFFIQDKLWKIVDDHKLGEKETWGKDFQAAMTKLAALYGVPGRVVPPDPDKGRYAAEVDWRDSLTHVRAVQRGDAAFAIIFEDNATLANLANLRVNKPAEDNGIDPAVAAATGGSKAPDPGPPPDKAQKPKGKH